MYIGLLIGCNEPSSSSGYCRMEGDFNGMVAFPVSAGYGEITHIALFDAAEGGVPVETIELPEPVDCHKGVIPIVNCGRLLRGLDVTAQIKLKAAGAARI